MSALVPGSRLCMSSLQLRLNVVGPRLSDLNWFSWDDSCLSDLRWWSDTSHLQAGLPLGLPPPDLYLFTDLSIFNWGASLADNHLSSLWSPLCSSFSIKHWELLAVLFAVHGFLPLLEGHLVALYADNTTALSYLKKQGGTHSSMLNAIAQVILRLCEVSGVRLLPQFILDRLNGLADSLSRGSQVLGPEWTLCRQAFQEALGRWPATIDLFATVLNHRLPVYFSPMVDPQSAGTDKMMQSWDGLQAYVFHPFGLLPRVLSKVWQSRGLETTLVAPFWPQRPWFPDLLELLVKIPIFLPHKRDLLRQPHFHHFHQNLSVLQLAAFCISSDPLFISASLHEWLTNLPSPDALLRV